MRASGSAFALLAALVPAAIGAQEFDPVLPVPLAIDAAAFLDAGLPPPARRTHLASHVARPFGLPELDVASTAAGASVRMLRVAAGIGRCGDPELGWNAAGVGIGCADDRGGLGVRAVARRDRLPRAAMAARGDAAWMDAREDRGMETGAGAWVTLGKTGRAWIAHPQLFARGSAPPLRRPLDAGIAWREDGFAAWIAREAAPTAAFSDAHRIGLALGFGRTWMWAEAREAPWRATLGVTGCAGPWQVAGAVDAHPALGQTVRLALTVGSRVP